MPRAANSIQQLQQDQVSWLGRLWL